MSIEICGKCKEESTPYFYSRAYESHVCKNCFSYDPGLIHEHLYGIESLNNLEQSLIDEIQSSEPFGTKYDE